MTCDHGRRGRRPGAWLAAAAVAGVAGVGADIPAFAEAAEFSRLAVEASAVQLGQAAEGEAARSFDIAAQPLAEALSRFGREAGLQIAADSELVAGLQTQGVQGTYTPEQALERLLAGTGLTYRRSGAASVVLKAEAFEARRAGPVRLDPLVVEAVPQLSRYDRDERYLTGVSSFALGGPAIPLQETPFSVSIADKDTLEDIAPMELDSISQFIPGVQSGNQVNTISQVFQSRGFQLGRDSILINGMQQSDGFAITPRQLVSNIEFYRGPSSVLNGQTPPGGAANIVTKKPLRERFLRLRGDFDQFGQKKGGADLNSGKVAIGPIDGYGRLNVLVEESQTFRDSGERDARLVAPVVSLDLTDRTRATFEFNYIDWRSTPDRGLPLLGGRKDSAAERFDESAFLLGTTDKQNKREQYRFMADISHRFSPHITSNFQLSYGETERDFFSVFARGIDPQTGRLVRDHFGTADEFKSLDVRLDSQFEFDTGPLAHSGVVAVQRRDFERRDLFTNFVGGADSVDLDNPDESLPFLADEGPGRGLEADQESWEQFLQDRVEVTTGLLEGAAATLGGRFIQFEEEAPGQADDVDEFVGRAGLSYTPPWADWATVYGSFSESFDPQSQTDVEGNPLPPQTGEQWEAGVKAELLERRILVSAAYFDLENTNVAVSDPNNPEGSIAVGVQENQGVELEATGALTDRLKMRAQYTFNDGEVIRASGNLAGNELVVTPDHSASLWLQYDFPRFANPLLQGRLDRLSVGGGAVYVGDRFADIENSIELTDYVRIDLNVRYVLAGNTEVQLNLKNITDERYFVGGNAFGGSVVPGEPFTALVTLRHTF